MLKGGKEVLYAGVGTPQADAVTIAAAWLAAIPIPAGTGFIDFMLDVAAYVVADRSEDDPANNGASYEADVHFRLPCQDATHLHLKRTAGDATIKWTVIS